jgi:hypothetical protein
MHLERAHRHHGTISMAKCAESQVKHDAPYRDILTQENNSLSSDELPEQPTKSVPQRESRTGANLAAPSVATSSKIAALSQIYRPSVDPGHEVEEGTKSLSGTPLAGRGLRFALAL